MFALVNVELPVTSATPSNVIVFATRFIAFVVVLLPSVATLLS